MTIKHSNTTHTGHQCNSFNQYVLVKHCHKFVAMETLSVEWQIQHGVKPKCYICRETLNVYPGSVLYFCRSIELY